MPKSRLEVIPGVGKSIAQDLANIGINDVSDLVGLDPDDVYDRSNIYAGVVQDPCLLYVFRGAVYYAEGGREPNLLKWWNWKEEATWQNYVTNRSITIQ